MFNWNKGVLSVQHVFAMFGATVLVPLLTGLNPAVALFCAGVGTLLFHFVTKGKVPVFLGSSFAFIVGIQTVGGTLGLEYATGGMLGVGVFYVIMSLVVYLAGPEKVRNIFPPIVTGPIIMVIGLILAPVAIDMASANWTIAIITIAATAFASMFFKGFFKSIPIIIGITVGYFVAAATGLVDFTPVKEASIFALPQFMAPKFSWQAMQVLVPIALVTVCEHLGDITTNGAVVGKDFLKNPGLHRTLLGDGLATAVAGAFGGPANTTYGENTGVLALTKVYDPAILRGAAVVAIVLSFIGKLGALLQTIPVPVMGGISFILFGMIANIGVKTLVDSKVDLSNIRNSLVVFSVLIVGLVSLKGEGNQAVITITQYASLSGLSLAAVLGITLNSTLEFLTNSKFLGLKVNLGVEKPQQGEKLA